MTRTLTAAELATTHRLVEQAIGRPLRQAEQAIDILKLDHALELAKNQVEQAVLVEQARAIRDSVRTRQPVRLRLTASMVKPLSTLFDLGITEALAELDRLGVTGARDPRATRAFETGPELPLPLNDLLDVFTRHLGAISVRVDGELVAADLSATQRAIVTALLRVPGARDLASRVVSAAMFGGMGQTWDENEDLVGGWERTAVLDAGTCHPCASSDGRRYPTWEAAQVDLPNGGPALNCLGQGRCRCRLVPIGPA